MAIRLRGSAPPPAIDSLAPEPIAPSRSKSRFFGALAKHDVFRRLWLASVASSIGQWMQSVALGWLAIEMTNSPAFVGIVTFAAGIPFVIVAPLGGSLIDRFDRRWMMLICQVLAFIIAVVLAIDVIGGFVQPWHLPVAAFLNGSLLALLSPTQQSLVPTLVPRSDLTNAIGLMSAGMNMSRVAGPSVAGVVIGAVGVGETFLIQAAAIAVSFVLVLGIVLPPRPARAAGSQGVFDGIALIASRPDLRGLFILASIPTLLVFPYIGFLNVFARDILMIGAEGLGLLMAVSGSGAVVGSLLVASKGRSDGVGKLLLQMTVAYGLVIVVVAISRSLWLTLPFIFLGGLLGSATMSSNNAVLQHRVTDDVRGRVMGAYMLTWGLMPLGALPMGIVAAQIGTPAAVAAGAILSSVSAAILGYSSPVLRGL